MALKPQMIDLQLFNGLETFVADKNVVGAKLLEAENCLFSRPGQLSKRKAFTALSQSSIKGNNLTTGVALSTYQDELLQFDGNEMFSYSENNQQWISKGFSSSVICQLNAILKNNLEQRTPYVCVTSSLKIYVWEELQQEFPKIKYTILDKETGNIIINNKLLAVGTNPKVVEYQNYLVVTYLDDNNLNFVQLDKGNLFFPKTAKKISDNVDTYDVQVANDYLQFAVTIDGSSAYGAIVYDALFNLYTTQYYVAGVSQLGMLVDERDNAWILTHQVAGAEGAGIYGFVLSPNQTVKVASTRMQVLSPDRLVDHIVGYSTNYGIDIVTETHRDEVDNERQHVVYKNQVKLAVSSITFEATAEFCRSVGIYSKPFNYNNLNYIIFAYQSDFQSCYFIINQNGYIVSRNVVGLAGGLRLREPCPVPLIVTDNIFIAPVEAKSQLQTNPGATKFFTVLGVSELTLDLNNSNQFLGVEIANNLYTVGGLLQSYDGVSASESTPLLFPEDIGYSLSAGSVTAGDHYYVIVYESTDRFGQVSYGTPSLPQKVTVDGYQAVTLRFPALYMTNKADEDVVINIYRTEANAPSDGLYYRVTSITDPIFNNKKVSSLSFNDNVSDDDLIVSQPLYTLGGNVLPNAAPLANSLIANYKNRVFLSGMEDGNVIWFSKSRKEGAPLEFSESLTLRCDNVGGRITALAILDEKLIIFKKSQIFYTIINDSSDTLNNPDQMAADVGCPFPNTIELTNDGLVFKSAKGIYTLGRNQDTPYTGQGANRFNNLEVTSAQLIASSNLLLFTTSENILMYDYFVKEWSTWTVGNCVDSCLWKNQYVVLKDSGQVWVQNSDYMDPTGKVRLRIKTDWIKPNNLMQSYMMVWKLFILGKYLSPHTLTVNAAFNYADFMTFQGQADATAMVAQPPRDTSSVSDGLYGSGNYGAGNYGYETEGSDGYYGTGNYPGIWIPYQMEFGVTDGNCESIQFEIYDDGEGAAFDINALSLEVGVMPYGMRLPDRNKFGLSNN